ncbi:hypothetical protein LCGC14_0245400 [marine sediment metagenome]|uniref:Uncharacterized protein n=1 Tax=marine sediment metagenome TaxID=412755 RepID=A0A0F9UAG6_9ZZZZ
MANVLIAKAFGSAKYGGTIAAPTTPNTAFDPSKLGLGCIGIFGLNKVDASTSGNTNREALITLATTGAGTTQDSEFLGDHIYIAQGLGSGKFTKTGLIEVAGISRIISVDYAVPVRQILSVGYHTSATTNRLTLPATIAKKDQINLKMSRAEVGTNDRTPLNFPLNAAASESMYNIMKRMAILINSKGKTKLFVNRVKVIDNDAAEDLFDNAATAAVVYGSASITTSQDHGVGVGDYVSLDGDLYLAITGTATTALVLDTPYRGPTNATLANSVLDDIGATVPTQLGLEITVYAFNEKYGISVEGVLEDADVAQITAPAIGIGYAPDVLEMENKELAYRGALDQIDRRETIPTTTTVLTAVYNMMFIEGVNTHGDRTGHKPGSPHAYSIICAFVDEAQTTGYNMNDAMGILATLFTDSTVIT